MIAREEIINSADMWKSTENLSSNVFDCLLDVGICSYYLKLKDNDVEILYGTYEPDFQCFTCIPSKPLLLSPSPERTIEAKEISKFLALPPVNFGLTSRYTY